MAEPAPRSSKPFQPVQLERVGLAGRTEADDVLAVEEPLEIRVLLPVDGEPAERTVSVTMRTPGHDAELAAGFLFTEGLVRAREDLLQIVPCRSNGNLVRVHLRAGLAFDPAKFERHFYTSSSCGVCGKASLEAVRTAIPCLAEAGGPVVAAETIHRLPERLRAAQAAFELTGGLHASALFDPEGMLLAIREDVGRHNALDKLIGEALLAGRVPLRGSILLVSGRVSFELVQKAAMAGIPVLAAVGAPSSLAVQLAEEAGMTLLGFVRENRFNLYCGGHRIASIMPQDDSAGERADSLHSRPSRLQPHTTGEPRS